jgi:hypothetical protein
MSLRVRSRVDETSDDCAAGWLLLDPSSSVAPSEAAVCAACGETAAAAVVDTAAAVCASCDAALGLLAAAAGL